MQVSGSTGDVVRFLGCIDSSEVLDALFAKDEITGDANKQGVMMAGPSGVNPFSTH